MNWNEIDLQDAKKDTLSGQGLKSGAFTIDIQEASIFRSPKSEFTVLTLKADVEGSTRYIKLMTTQKDGKAGFDSKRVTQMLALLRITPSTITEVKGLYDNTFIIPQLKGVIGALIEVKPAFACKPNNNGDQYPELSIIQFFNNVNGKTIKEESEGLEPKSIMGHIPTLEKKEYKPFGGVSNTPISNEPEQIPDNLPFG